MNKLTVAKAKQIIAGLKENAAYAGPSIRDDYMLQALEIALPVLEQQEKEGDGWIEWGGGECPVPDNTRVQVKFLDGYAPVVAEPQYLRWQTLGLGVAGDIIAYRVIENDGREG